VALAEVHYKFKKGGKLVMVDPECADKCPNCNERGMRKWPELATARRCCLCGHIEERYRDKIADWIKNLKWGKELAARKRLRG
jgi:hypothetical protein